MAYKSHSTPTEFISSYIIMAFDFFVKRPCRPGGWPLQKKRDVTFNRSKTLGFPVD
jgi:hypothetical protein